MNALIAWFARNSVAANLTMVGILLVGLLTITGLRQEVVPTIEVEAATVSVVYPGASPKEVETGILMPIEKVVQGLSGVDTVSATANENLGIVTIDFLDGEDRQEMLDEIKSAVDRIDSFPDEIEEPQVELVDVNNRVMNIAIWGEGRDVDGHPVDIAPHSLRSAAKVVDDALMGQPDITLVHLSNEPDLEISIEVAEEDLRRHGLSFDEVAAAVRLGSIDIPSGAIQTDGGEILLRTTGQAYTRQDFEGIPLRRLPDGTRLELGQVAQVRDGFAETDQKSRFNGNPAVMLRVFRVGKQEALVMAEQALAAMDAAREQLPKEIRLSKVGDDTMILRSRLDLMLRNGRSGLILVLFALAIFLRLRLALWVTIGIPLAFLGAAVLMPSMDVSVNLISLFGFIVVLGIVVDDAIVVAENVHEHRQRGKPGLQAAIEGTQEMAKPVIFAVLTTIVAFLPMLMMPGNMGQFSRNIPLIVIVVLIFSLVEALLILPAHLKHIPADARDQKLGLWGRFQATVNRHLDGFIEHSYRPSLEVALRWRYAMVAIGVALFLVTLGYVGSGRIKFNFFPAIEADNVVATLEMPLGTPVERTEEAIRRLEDIAEELQEELKNEAGTPLIRYISTSVGAQPMSDHQRNNGGVASASRSGGHLAEVNVELISAEEREVSGRDILRMWQERVGPIPGVERLSFSSDLMTAEGDINIQLSGAGMESLKMASIMIQQRMQEIVGVESTRDSFIQGKEELTLRLTPEGEAMGFRLGDLGRQVRQAFHGKKIQTLHRDREEVEVHVRYPKEDRTLLATLEEMRLRDHMGREVPFSVAASATLGRGFSKIDRRDRRRSINVLADIDEKLTTADTVVANLSADFLPQLLADHPGLRYSLEGQNKEQGEFMGALLRVNLMALLAIFVLLAIPLSSYVQPLIIMSAIPFGMIGAVAGHALLGYDLAIFSLIGIVALSGIVINDSLVMIDLINRERAAGIPVLQAVRDAGVRRFRAIMLTTLTTFLGLTPLLLEKSLQAKFLIPMAVSVAFGVVFATLITLILVPSLYMISEDAKFAFRRLRRQPIKI